MANTMTGRKSIYIRSDLHKALRIKSIETGVSLQRLIDDVLTSGMKLRRMLPSEAA